MQYCGKAQSPKQLLSFSNTFKSEYKRCYMLWNRNLQCTSWFFCICSYFPVGGRPERYGWPAQARPAATWLSMHSQAAGRSGFLRWKQHRAVCTKLLWKGMCKNCTSNILCTNNYMYFAWLGLVFCLTGSVFTVSGKLTTVFAPP